MFKPIHKLISVVLFLVPAVTSGQAPLQSGVDVPPAPTPEPYESPQSPQAETSGLHLPQADRFYPAPPSALNEPGPSIDSRSSDMPQDGLFAIRTPASQYDGGCVSCETSGGFTDCEECENSGSRLCFPCGGCCAGFSQWIFAKYPSTCDMYQHHAYFPEAHGYYFFRPYNYLLTNQQRQMFPTITGSFVAPYTSANYQPIYAAAAERGLPVILEPRKPRKSYYSAGDDDLPTLEELLD